MNTYSRIMRILVALTLACVALVFMSMSTAAAASAKPPGHVKLSATLLDTKVKVNAKARIQGRLDVEEPLPIGRSGSLLEVVVVQQLKAGIWVDVSTGSCRPNLTFKLSVSFSLAATYTLRLYHPPTTIVATAQTDAFVLAVVP